MNDALIGQAIANANYALMSGFDTYAGTVLIVLVFTLSLVGLTPLRTHTDHNFLQVSLVWYRRCALVLLLILVIFVVAMYAFYVGMNTQDTALNSRRYWHWLGTLSSKHGPMMVIATATALLLRFGTGRYLVPKISGVWRRWRVEQTNEKLDDIRDLSADLNAIVFTPQSYYSAGKVLLGLNDKKEPIQIDDDVWEQTHMQIVGPTRYGKGVLIGCILDQQIRKGRRAFYIDPQGDQFVPHIMYRAAKESGRRFIYLDLSDDGVGSWAPFRGGTSREATTRLEMAFSLESTGDAGTDYYKVIERKGLDVQFQTTRSIPELRQRLSQIKSMEESRIFAELSLWSNIKSLCPPESSGFNMDEAMLTNAVVYVKGSLDDVILKRATTIFIAELIQSAKRLSKQLTVGTDMVIDEVSSLVSRTLAMSLATSLKFGVKFVLAYQSQNDLLNIEDSTVSGRYIYQSINVNSQIKAVYGGFDYDTADWVSKFSGTVQKSVPKMERSEINEAGGEYWSNLRFMGSEEANLISVNKVLALPFRIAVVASPGNLAQLCYTAFVAIDSQELLNTFLETQALLEDEATQSSASARLAETEESSAVKSDLEVVEDMLENSVEGADDERRNAIRQSRRARKKLQKAKREPKGKGQGGSTIAGVVEN